MELDQLSVVIVTFRSEDKINSCLGSIPTNIPVILVENSNNVDFKKKIENQFSNVECILTGGNNGYAVANNIGLGKVKTKYALVLNPDAIIKKDTISIFEKNNIKAIESINKKLDPNFHQAMIEIEDDTKEPGTIIQEIQKGFTIKDRLLRPSLVGVSKKISKKDEKTEKNEENIKDK